jgi:enamine deaminase RidA (YjgF/YER057c/UK114 family)
MPHAITLTRSASLSSVAEYAYSATALARSRLIFLAGACPLNEDGSTVAVGDYAGQAAKAIQNMRTALADAGASLEDVLRLSHPVSLRLPRRAAGARGGLLLLHVLRQFPTRKRPSPQ